MKIRRRVRPSRGQTLILFALSLTMLLALVGFLFDGLRGSLARSQAQRAAEAAALAGVTYLPAYPDAAHPAPDGNNATNRAVQEAARNGFTDASQITVSPVTGTPPRLRVTISFSIGISLLAIVNSAPIAISASATAQGLPPFTIGDGSNIFGQPDADAGNTAHYLAAIAGPNELKEAGDAFNVLCESGSTDATQTNLPTSAALTYLGTATNQVQYPGGPQCSPGSPGNPDTIPVGSGGLASRNSPTPMGTSYLIAIPPGTSSYTVQVYNPRFLYVQDTLSQFNLSENIFQKTLYWYRADQASFYPRIAYSLFQVSQLTDRSQDRVVAALWPATTSPDTTPDPSLPAANWTALPPLDSYWFDMFLHGCTGSAAWNLSGGSSYNNTIAFGTGCFNPYPGDVNNWVAMPYTINAGTATTWYRLTADTLPATGQGYGQHSYAVRICLRGTGTGSIPCQGSGATVGSWTNATLIPRGGTSGTWSYPIMTIPQAYAGRHVILRLFNAGIGPGSITVKIAPPPGGGSVNYPSSLRMTADNSAIQTSLAGDSRYHGKWIDLSIALPANYTGGTWTLVWTSTTAVPNNMNTMMTVTAKLAGSSISLLSP